jgi:hypothetical protein
VRYQNAPMNLFSAIAFLKKTHGSDGQGGLEYGKSDRDARSRS